MTENGSFTLHFPTCTVTWFPQWRKCVTEFSDGTQAHAIPHDTPEYRQHAEEKSTGDPDLYCWQHDIAHVIVGMNRGGVSKVLWALAHGEPTDTPECDAEEREAQEFQKVLFLRKCAQESERSVHTLGRCKECGFVVFSGKAHDCPILNERHTTRIFGLARSGLVQTATEQAAPAEAEIRG